jgi:NitT/TauT family transport system ATP-binding protein
MLARAADYLRPRGPVDSSADGILGIEIGRLNHHYLRVTGKQAEAVTALTDITLNIGACEFVAFVGPSGCGKTTLLNILGGLIEPQTGTVSVAGSRPRAGRRDVAYMFARDALLPWRTACANVTFGLESLGLSRSEMTSRALEMLERVRVADFQRAYPSQLSHGMRQRVALARTFALPSKVLLMDEPFAALDAHLRIEAGDVLLKLWERDRRTVVFVTHDLHEAIALADRVIVFAPRPGRISTEFVVPFARPRSVEQLQENPQYHELYRHLWRAMAATSTDTREQP